VVWRVTFAVQDEGKIGKQALREGRYSWEGFAVSIQGKGAQMSRDEGKKGGFSSPKEGVRMAFFLGRSGAVGRKSGN